MPLSSPVLAVAALLLAVASAQPARFPCGTVSPNQRVCDSLSHPTARRTSPAVPINSICVKAASGGFYCGWQGARCTADTQCDFGLCSSEAGEPGVCMGGLGDLCEGPDGPDDSLCMGNLGCQSSRDGVLGKAVCGGSGADCSYGGAYEPGTVPNHLACVSGYCNPSTLTCSTKTPPSAGRPQAAFYRADGPPGRVDRIPVAARPPSSSAQRPRIPAGASCPIGFTLCPIRPNNEAEGDEEGFDFACVDTNTSLSHCGGCPSIGAGFWGAASEPGVDCMALEGVYSAACVDAKCRVFSCSSGFEFDRTTGECMPKKYW
ncbi:hypothetical protein JCM8547_004351 [Rhodosporidiobolus lusitaniae]